MEKYSEKDKSIAAFLLICKNLKFQGTQPNGEVLLFLFSPANEAKRQAELFYAKQAEPIQPKDYAEAQQTIIDLIWRWRKSKDGGIYYGRQRY